MYKITLSQSYLYYINNVGDYTYSELSSCRWTNCHIFLSSANVFTFGYDTTNKQFPPKSSSPSLFCHISNEVITWYQMHATTTSFSFPSSIPELPNYAFISPTDTFHSAPIPYFKRLQPFSAPFYQCPRFTTIKRNILDIDFINLFRASLLILAFKICLCR